MIENERFLQDLLIYFWVKLNFGSIVGNLVKQSDLKHYVSSYYIYFIQNGVKKNQDATTLHCSIALTAHLIFDNPGTGPKRVRLMSGCHREYVTVHAEQIHLRSRLDHETRCLLGEGDKGGLVCVSVLTWHCWRNGMTPPVKPCHTLKSEARTAHAQHLETRRGRHWWLLFRIRLSRLRIFFFPFLSADPPPLSFISLCRSCSLERPPTENTIPRPMVLCCQDRERPLAW